MAVAHSAASESHTGVTPSTNQASFAWVHTQTGTPQGVVVFVFTFLSTADLITSVTYGGVALTRLAGGSAQDAAGEAGRCDAFFLGSGLGTGNQIITVNRTNNATAMYASAATVTAAANTAVPTATIVLLEGDGTLAVQSVDDTSPGQNSVRYAGAYSGLNAPPTAGTGSTLLNSIDIGNYGAALVRETTAGQGARNVGFTGATDDRAVVHLAIRELVPRTETPIVGAFTLTGGAPTLTKASPKEMDATVGAFSLTGNAADLRHNLELGPVVGSFTAAGNDADLTHARQLTADPGAFTLAGGSPDLLVTVPKQISAETGAFVLDGNPASLARTWALTAEAGAFALAGNPATLADTDKLVANAGSFALTGGESAFLRTYYLSGGAGAFIETGQPVTFARTWALYAGTGAFALTGNPVAITTVGALEIAPTVGQFSLTGNQATFTQNQLLPVDAGQYELTGGGINLARTYVLPAAAGAITLAGQTATLTATQALTLAADVVGFTFTGQQATLRRNRLLAPAAGAFALAGNAAAFTEAGNFQILPAAGAFALTGNSVIFTDVDVLLAGIGSVALTGLPVELTKTERRRVVIFI